MEITQGGIVVRRFQHEGFSAAVPGDPSSAAFLIAAAALTGSEITITDVGLNPTRTHFLDVMGRMGVPTEQCVRREELGEPVGDIHVSIADGIHAVRVGADELPLVIDEVPVLAMLAAHAASDSWFLEAGELKVKESDRLEGLAAGIRDLGGHAAAEGDDLVVAGGGLVGGRANAHDDHRMAMAFAVSALAAHRPVEVDGIETAEVSFPGFLGTLSSLGASIEGSMSSPRVVAIDGAAGSGKSTLAGRLAKALGLPYVNTGLMYRALAAAAVREGVSSDDERGLLQLTAGLRFILRVEPPGELEVEGYGVEELMSVEVESMVSAVASHPVVRAAHAT